MINKSEILSKLTELKPELKGKYGVSEIGLFGSFGDGSFTNDSDIDLLIELDRPIGWEFFTLQVFLENVFGRKVDLVTKNALRERMKPEILKTVSYAE